MYVHVHLCKIVPSNVDIIACLQYFCQIKNINVIVTTSLDLIYIFMYLYNYASQFY